MKSTEEYIISIKNLKKTFKNHIVLDNVSLNIHKGRIYGIQGRNGSGKTMLLRAICGLIIPDSGEIYVKGYNVTERGVLPDKVGALIEIPGFINYYSGFRNLKILSSIRDEINDEQIYKILSLLGLKEVANKKVRTYSLGMRQRLGIAQAIMEEPDLILLDEPTNALDNEGVTLLRNLLKELRNNGVTIILTSHNKEDIELLCDEVFYMDNGKLIRNVLINT